VLEKSLRFVCWKPAKKNRIMLSVFGNKWTYLFSSVYIGSFSLDV
jgi:hypothetical protein